MYPQVFRDGGKVELIVRENGCVMTAVSTIRLLLGYKRSWPKDVPMPDDGLKTTETIGLLHKFFPYHSVEVWCKEENFDVSKRQVVYMGTTMPPAADTSHIYFFDYSSSSDGGSSHMVVGYPRLYEGMYSSMFARVSLEPISRLRFALGKYNA